MALKDWKRVDRERHYLYGSWERKDETLSLTVFKKGTKKMPQVQIHKRKARSWVIVSPAKSFKTKSQAMKFAKAYMKKH